MPKSYQFIRELTETASAGSTSAGSIAVNMNGPSRRDLRTGDREFGHETEEEKRYKHAREQIAKAKRLKKERENKKKGFKSFLRRRLVGESFDLNDIVSRLKDADIDGNNDDNNVVSYGIEDDNGNVMRVTVRADQAQEFEEEISKRLADQKEGNERGTNLKNESLAEILFNMRDKFEIVSVDFPIIPKDVVYNAKDVSEAPPDVNNPNSDEDFTDMEDEGEGDDFGDNLDFGNDQGSQDQGQDMGMDQDMDQDMNPEGGENGEAPEGGESENGEEVNPEDLEGDNVEDFEENPEEESASSLLQQVLDMIKKQAEAETAKANADAEEAKAKQAEYTAMSTEKEMARQEDLARMEADANKQKEREKQAKKIAQLAKYKAGLGEGHESILKNAIHKLKEDADVPLTPDMVNKEKEAITQKYKIHPDDDQMTQSYKKQAYNKAMRILNDKVQLANLDRSFNSARKTQQRQNPQNNQQQNNQQPNQQNPQQPSQQNNDQPDNTL